MSIISELKKSVMTISRDKKLNHFYSLFKEGQSVLDVGVLSEMRPGLPARNYFLKHYRYGPESYTGLGIDDLSRMKTLFPEHRFVQYSGKEFPFSDREFDWIFCNAVIEHIVDEAAQLFFLNEMLRVADHIFFTTPNKYFPVESHTNVLFLHWNDDVFYKFCKKNRLWANRNNLSLFSFKQLEQILKESDADEFTVYKNRFFGIPMTYTVICNGLK